VLSTWLKRGLFAFIGLIALVVVGFVSLIFLIDPNDWKPQVEKLAAEQGYELKLTGDIEWQLFPRLGLSLGAMSVRALNTDASLPPLLSVNQTAASVAVRPLFARQVQIDHITVDQPVINLIADKDGNLNLAPTSEAPVTDTATSSGEGQSFDIAVQTITINAAQLHYRDDQTGQVIELNPLTLTASDVNNKGNSFPVTLSLTFAHEAFVKPLTLELDGKAAFDQVAQTLQLNDASLAASSSDANATLSTDLSASFGEAVSAEGQLKLDTLNPRQWLIALAQTPPDTADPDALTRLGFSSTFKFANDQLTLNPFKFELDDTTGTGGLTLTLPTGNTPVDVNTTLAITQLNLDNYLAPVPEDATRTPTQAPVSTPTAATIETPLPLDSFHAAHAKLSL